jgi:hypothetical protein
MKFTYLSEEIERQEFAKKAAKNFSEFPDHYTYAKDNPEKGGLLALRWGADNDCVLVIKIDENFEPTIYQQIIGASAPDSLCKAAEKELA